MMKEAIEIKIKEIKKLEDREEAYYQIVELYIKGPEDVREYIRQGWDFGIEWTYPDQKRLACSKNEKRSCRTRIEASLVYDSIENMKREDPRDKLIALAVIYHSCIAAGLDPSEEIRKIASISTTKISKFFLNFINRDPEDKSKEAFMIVTKQNLENETEIYPSWMET